VEYEALRAMRAVLASRSPAARLRLSKSLGRLVGRLAAGRKRIALANLELAYPGQTPEWRRQIADRSFEHLGRLLGELLLLDRDGALAPAEIEGWEHLERVASTGKGYVLVSGHFGNWELLAQLQAMRGFPVSVVARPSDNPLLDAELTRVREMRGNRVIYKRQAVREIVKVLKSGGGVGLVIDQNYREQDPHFVPFFGVPAATTRTLGTLCVRMNVPFITGFAFPRPDGSYRIVYQQPVHPEQITAADPALEITSLATAQIEAAIRQQPEAWFWMHQRWRTRPV
jgi:Kdo2-lipid IVA lauroyltransferase/acyltransferase